MKKYFSFIILLFFVLVTFSKNVNADIDLIVSPIRYELDVNPWESLTKTAKLINKTWNEMNIYTWVSDFQANDNYWNPTFVRKSELVNPDQEMASWIDLEVESFFIWAFEEREISFTVNVPNDATPWWHYWAVFFKTLWEENASWSWQLKINVDYWVLLLIRVDWEIIDNTTPWTPTINTWWGWTNNTITIDHCPFWDFTSSNFDWKCFDTFWFENAIQKILKKDNKSPDVISINPTWNNANTWEFIDLSSAQENIEDFVVEFNIPMINEWNTHVKPEWKITLTDENWNVIRWIWKESIVNENWMIIWEKIVDYLPINDWGWNILPNTQRIFSTEWKWFPYETFDESWKRIIEYWTPWEYYSRLNLADRTYLYPWERINKRLEQKKISALIELSYINYDWEKIKFNSAEEFYVDYTTEYIWLNPYFILISVVSLWILWFIFFIWRRKTRKKCCNCKKVLKKDMKICPYCGTNQEEKCELKEKNKTEKNEEKKEKTKKTKKN